MNKAVLWLVDALCFGLLVASVVYLRLDLATLAACVWIMAGIGEVRALVLAEGGAR